MTTMILTWGSLLRSARAQGRIVTGLSHPIREAMVGRLVLHGNPTIRCCYLSPIGRADGVVTMLIVDASDLISRVRRRRRGVMSAPSAVLEPSSPQRNVLVSLCP